MAKKNKIVQMQSPENYIRTRARNLEIFECMVDESWEDVKMANVIVARKHTNGNITYAIYLVDLLCLGVKNSLYAFNESEGSYRERMKSWHEVNNFKKIEYALAHNIVYAAVEFAEDFGFKPHKTFTDVTQYLLEEDTDAIELIDIECGMDGKPAYFQGPNDNQTTVNRILKQLETTAGKGNFNFTIEGEKMPDFASSGDDFDEDDEDYDEDDEDDFDEEEDFEDDFDEEDDLDEEDDFGEDENLMGYDEAILIFKENEPAFENLEMDKLELFLQALHVLFQPLINQDLYKQYYKDFYEDLEIMIVSGKMPYKALGMQISDKAMRNEIINSIDNFLNEDTEDNEKTLKMLQDLKSQYGDIPIFSFLEIIYVKINEVKDVKEKIKEYENRFPDYPLFKISSLMYSYSSILKQNPEEGIIPLHTFFPNRSRFHIIEMQEYIMYASFFAAYGTDLSRMLALHDVLVDLDYPNEILGFVFPLVTGQKIIAIKASLGMPD
jgi:hypothetical protein